MKEKFYTLIVSFPLKGYRWGYEKRERFAWIYRGSRGQILGSADGAFSTELSCRRGEDSYGSDLWSDDC